LQDKNMAKAQNLAADWMTPAPLCRIDQARA